VEHRKADVRQVAGHRVAGDDPSRFLSELRELRDGAGLGHAELAARAHYPYDSIRAAEVGPGLPELPVLSAYVRGCGGTTEEWEERWRSLTRTPSLPVPAARHVGSSAAAAAGARLNSSGQDGDSPNPAIIIAALNRVAEEMAAGKSGTPSGSADLPTRPGPAQEAAPAVPAAAVPEDQAPAAQVTELPTRPAPAFQAPPPPAAASAEKAEPAADGKPASGWGELAAGGKPASAWDPIRMSSAWPALRSTSSDTGSSGGASSSGSARTSGSASTSDRASASGAASSSSTADSSAVTGQGTPWGTVPWAEQPASRPAAAAARAAGSAVPAHAGSGSTVPSGFAGSRTRLIVIAAVALVVLIVLLAIFA
jgi:hypothetical protein